MGAHLQATFLPAVLAAGTLGWLAWRLAGMLLALRRTSTEKILAAYAAPAYARASSGRRGGAAVGSPAYKIGLAFAVLGLPVAGRERLAMLLAYGVCGLALAAPVLLLELPVVLAAGAPFLGYVALNAFVDARWQQFQVEIEREVPRLLSRLASLLKADANLMDGLSAVAEGLDPHQPLQAWVLALADAFHAGGRERLAEMQAEAARISPALLLAVIEVRRAAETGGGMYSQAMRLTASNLSDLLETRAQAHAVAAGAWSAARTILLALGLTLGIVLVNPVSKAYFSAPLIQAALLLVMVWGGIGYWNIRDTIRDVVE